LPSFSLLIAVPIDGSMRIVTILFLPLYLSAFLRYTVKVRDCGMTFQALIKDIRVSHVISWSWRIPIQGPLHCDPLAMISEREVPRAEAERENYSSVFYQRSQTIRDLKGLKILGRPSKLSMLLSERTGSRGQKRSKTQSFLNSVYQSLVERSRTRTSKPSVLVSERSESRLSIVWHRERPRLLSISESFDNVIV
jgi:hypothetical protein